MPNRKGQTDRQHYTVKRTKTVKRCQYDHSDPVWSLVKQTKANHLLQCFRAQCSSQLQTRFVFSTVIRIVIILKMTEHMTTTEFCHVLQLCQKAIMSILVHTHSHFFCYAAHKYFTFILFYRRKDFTNNISQANIKQKVKQY